MDHVRNRPSSVHNLRVSNLYYTRLTLIVIGRMITCNTSMASSLQTMILNPIHDDFYCQTFWY